MGSQIVVGGDLDFKELKSLKTIPLADVACYKGKMFLASILLSLDAAATQDLGFETATDKNVIWFNDSVSADVNYVSYKLYEDAVFTGDTEQDVINLNRQSDVIPGTKLHNAISSVDITGAVLVDTDATLGGNGAFGTSTGDNTDSRKGMILKKGTKYLIRLENVDSNAATVSVHSTFIEYDTDI